MITPRATEKAYIASQKDVYIFFVPCDASKQAIAKAVADEFKVTVENVRVLNRKGKATRFSRGKHAMPGTTFRQDHKVAYVTVKKGDKIPVFDEIKEDKSDKTTKAEKTEAKAVKKTTKKAAKEEEK